MAKPRDQDLEYIKRAEKMDWKALRRLWNPIRQERSLEAPLHPRW